MPAPPLIPGRFPSSSAGPVVIKRVDPQWPAAAQAAGVQGMVVVELAVAADGTVRDARVLRSVPLLDEAALAAARQWRFAPAGPEGRTDPVMFTAVFGFPAR
jgi:protein TonB